VTTATDLKTAWVSEAMNFSFPCYYNSSFELPPGPNENAVLTIWLRLNLMPMSGTLKGGVYTGVRTDCARGGVKAQLQVPIRDWAGDEWQRFVEECHISATFWDFRFYLTPPAGYHGLDLTFGQARYRPFVECRFEAKFVEAGEGPHVRYEAMRLLDSAHEKDRERRLAGEESVRPPVSAQTAVGIPALK
jgi:hypothetical protein